MVTKTVKRTKKREQSPSLEVKPFTLVIRDFRIVSAKSERFSPPEVASKGRYSLKVGDLEVVCGDKRETGPLVISYKASLIGHKALEKVEGEIAKAAEAAGSETASQTKSFSIEVVIEAMMRLEGTGTCAMDVLQALIEQNLPAIHVLTIEKLRAAASDLGYRTVRPSLSSINMRIHERVVEPTVGRKKLEA